MSPPTGDETRPLRLSACWPTGILQPNPRPRQQSKSSRSDFVSTTNSLLFPNSTFSSPESLPSLSQSFSIFSQTFPRFHDTDLADQVRGTEFTHLAARTSLDYSGIGLFTPISPPSSDFDISFHSQETSTEASIRARILKFLNLQEQDYSAHFTASHSSAFKLLAEVSPFKKNSSLIAVYDYENESVSTMIDAWSKRGGKVILPDFIWPSLRIASETLNRMILSKKRGIIVFPIQSLISGAKYSYQWLKFAKENGWYIALDTLAMAPKDLDSFGLSLIQPDFVICSFYKIFGENPAGFGALFVRRILNLRLTGRSGIVRLIPPGDYSALDRSGEFDRSASFSRRSMELAIEEAEIDCRGLNHADSLGMIHIGWRLRCITNWLVNVLTKLRHPHLENGSALTRIYGPRVKFDRGSAIAFNIFDWKGEKIEPALVQKLADRCGISLSCGFLCNIRFPEKYGHEKATVLERREKKGGVDSGISVVSASFGFLSDFEDAYKLWEFVAKFLDADFVERERWRYMALNRKVVEI